jgi:hypothetical protein
LRTARRITDFVARRTILNASVRRAASVRHSAAACAAAPAVPGSAGFREWSGGARENARVRLALPMREAGDASKDAPRRTLRGIPVAPHDRDALLASDDGGRE